MADPSGSAATSVQGVPRKRYGWPFQLWRRLTARIRRLFGNPVPENVAEAKDAVGHFLRQMEAVAARTFPDWSKMLHAGLDDCSLSFEDRRSIVDIHPLDDYYFAGIVALEAARMRAIYPPREADEILSEIGDQVDDVMARKDRVVSDLVFFILGRIDLGADLSRGKTPHDKVIKSILEYMGFNKNDSTRALIRDIAFRHMLSEPLALYVPRWWNAFHEHFTISWPDPEPTEADEDISDSSYDQQVMPTKRARSRWRTRRAESLLDG